MFAFCVLNLVLPFISGISPEILSVIPPEILSVIPPEILSVIPPKILSVIPPINYTLTNAVKADISYFLYKNSQAVPSVLDENVSKIDFNRNLPTKLFVHGFTTNPDLCPWYPLLKQEYFLKENLNIIYVDWSKAGNLSYFVSGANVKPVGEYMANFLIAAGIPPENIHLIGHSLGSHLTGFAGKFYLKKTGKKIGRITALDPAGPAFEKLKPDLRLSRGDAEFVDVIHTDIGHYGFSYPLGDVDFYPNGGKKQIACVKDQDDSCDHAKSTHYFVESVNKKKWIAKKSQYDNFNITYPGEVVFGDGVPPSTRGVYYLFINNSTPYPYLRSNRRIM